MHSRKHLLLLLPFLFSLLTFSLLTSCSGKTAGASQTGDFSMAPMDSMPVTVKLAPTTVQQAYQFAAANPDTLKHIPCYCGCVAMGHTSNYSCYVQDVDATGKVTFDEHALGCSICVDITQDVMRLLKQKETIQEIRAYIDSTYSQYGPSTIGGFIVPVSFVADSDTSVPL